MTRPLIVCILIAAGCNTEPDEGVFVGNPGKNGVDGELEVAAAPTDGFMATGRLVASSVTLAGCDGTSEQLDLDALVLRLERPDDLTFTADRAVAVPAGTWCSLSLSLAEVALDVTSLEVDGSTSHWLIDFADLEITVSGRAFAVDEQMLSLQLGDRYWLEGLQSYETEDEALDLLELAPEFHSELRDRLEGRSALFLVSPPSEDSELVDAAPDVANGEAPLWAGEDREPETTWTEPTTAPLAELSIALHVPFEDSEGPLGEPAIVEELNQAYVPIVSADFGASLIVLDIANGAWVDSSEPGSDPESTGAAVGYSELEQVLHFVVAESSSITSYQVAPGELFLEPHSEIPVGGAQHLQIHPLGQTSFLTWLDDGGVYGSWLGMADLVPLAEGATDYHADGDGESLVLAWSTEVYNPTSGETTRQVQAAWLGPEDTVLLPQATTQGSLPRVAVDGEHVVVASQRGSRWPDVTVLRSDGTPLAVIEEQAEGISQWDIDVVGDVVVVAWATEQQAFVQLFDALDGSPVSTAAWLYEPVVNGDLHVRASTVAGELVVDAVAGGSSDPSGFTRLTASSLP